MLGKMGGFGLVRLVSSQIGQIRACWPPWSSHAKAMAPRVDTGWILSYTPPATAWTASCSRACRLCCRAGTCAPNSLASALQLSSISPSRSAGSRHYPPWAWPPSLKEIPFAACRVNAVAHRRLSSFQAPDRILKIEMKSTETDRICSFP